MLPVDAVVLRILVVEDELRLPRSRARALREEGHAVDTAETGSDGLFKAESHDCSAVVLEVMLPELDAGQVVLDRQPVDLAECARAGAEFFQPLARERGIQLQLDLSPCETEGDAERLYRAILNLLTNAIAYNRPAGEIRVRTRLEAGNAIVVITDTGQGMAPADLPHVFERFYRADKSRAANGQRTGLGLAIVKAIVDAHGGSITLTSEPGAGATCELRLPAKA